MKELSKGMRHELEIIARCADGKTGLVGWDGRYSPYHRSSLKALLARGLVREEEGDRPYSKKLYLTQSGRAEAQGGGR